MSSAQRKNKKTRGRKRKGNRQQQPMTHAVVTANRFNTILPTECTCWLKFNTYGALTSVSSFVNKRFNPNAAYDVDPVLGSTSTPGFAELAAIYGYYRVIEYKFKFMVANENTFPVMVMTYQSNTDPGLGSTLMTLVGNPMTQYEILSGSAGGPCKRNFSGKHTVAQIVGSSYVETDDSFSSAVTTVPSNRVWSSLSIDSGVGGNVLTSGVLYAVEFWMLTRFFERKNLTS